MEFSRSRVIKITIMLVFLCCMLFANFFAVRMILSYGVDTYFFDKLLVAYTVGGTKGLKMELNKIQITDKLRRESMLVKDFSTKLETLADPEAYLTDKVQESKKRIFFVRNLRSVAILIMFILFSWRIIINYRSKFKSKKFFL